MLSYCVVTPSSVVSWILNPKLADELSRAWLWIILTNTIKKMAKHVIKIKNEYAEIQENAILHDGKDMTEEN